jgi:hypothetical protein
MHCAVRMVAQQQLAAEQQLQQQRRCSWGNFLMMLWVWSHMQYVDFSACSCCTACVMWQCPPAALLAL